MIKVCICETDNMGIVLTNKSLYTSPILLRTGQIFKQNYWSSLEADSPRKIANENDK